MNVTPPHPYSLQHSKEKAIQEAALQGGSGSVFAVQVIDNTHSFSTKYINVPGGPIPVTSKYDISRQPGIYITTLCQDGDTCLLKPRCDYLEFHELATSKYKGMFYESYDLAVAYGDVVAEKERQYKLEIAKLQYEIQTSKMVLAERAANLEHEKRELDLQRERMKIQQDRFEYETHQRTEQIKFGREEELLRIRREDERRKEDHERLKATLERENLILKDRMERLKAEHDRESMLLKAEMERFKIKSEQENLKLKDHYENKSNRRKASIEIAKMIPILITAFFTVKSMMDKGK
jgi:hypothetical protein